MKKIMISHGIRGIVDVKSYVTHCKNVVDNYYKNNGEIVEILNTFFEDFDGNRLQFLGKSISEGIAICDEIVFMDNWLDFDGCKCENYIAYIYNKPMVYLVTNYDGLEVK